ncbi:DUF4282 domain-containing protein [Streptosporangium sandarakinum]|uniref:DUF4282 domain-containing protein n=1 Tax=Streptosporangium sandarakinum TaxID=1260955 RepID=UPI00343DC301
MTNPYQGGYAQDPQPGYGHRTQGGHTRQSGHSQGGHAQDPYQAGQPYGQSGQSGHTRDPGSHSPGRTPYTPGQYTRPAHQQPAPPPGGTRKGFFARLFDLSFDHYVTTSIIKVIFVILVVIEVLWALSTLALAFDTGPESGVIALLLTPIGLFLAILLTRVWMELLVVIFKIKEDLGAIRDRGGL